MTRRRWALFAVAAVLLVLFGGRWLALRYTEAVWFADLGQGERYRAMLFRGLAWQAATFVFAFAWFTAHTLGVHASIGAVHLPRRLGNLEIDEAVPGRILRGIAIGTAALLALACTYTFSDLDQYVSLARAAVPLGQAEPVLHRDAAFYLAVLPLLEVLHLLATVLAVLAALLVIGLYAITGSLAVTRRRVRITPHARTHLVILLAAIALVVAWGFQVDGFQLVAGGGHLQGALSPVDRSIRIPASNALAVLALAVAVGSALALRWVRPGLLFGLWALLGIMTLLGRLIIPVMAEAWGNPPSQEVASQVAQQAENFSRMGFGLTNVRDHTLPAADVRADSTAALEQAVAGLYAWSGQPELPSRMLDDLDHDSSNLRLWSITPTVSRDAAGRLRPAALAVPQTDAQQAARIVPRPQWEKLHREGLAWGGQAVALDGTPHAGLPQGLRSLDPADTAPAGTPLAGAPPRIRFLPHVAELAIVGPDEGSPTEPAPGVLLGNIVRRVLIGWALQSPPLLDEHTSRADRVLYWRDVPARLSRLYPFAGFDPARGAMVNGRLTWVVDGYLMSSRFPLAQSVRWRGEDINYLTSPYIVTVDAVSGATRMYLRPASAAFAASVARSSGVTPLPAESLPAGLRATLRYPENLIGGQAAQLAMRAPGEDEPELAIAWHDTSEITHDAALIHPTAAIAAIDGEPRPWLFVPLVDARGTHLAATVAGTVSPAGDLQVVMLRVAGTNVPAPLAAAARINNSPALLAAGVALSGPDHVSRQGPLLVTPAAGTIVFAQLIFSLGRVGDPVHVDGIALLAAGHAGFGGDPKAAVRSLLHGDTEAYGTALAGAELGEARTAFIALDSARMAGDWERFGRAWQALRRALHLEPAAGPLSGPRPPAVRP